MISWMQKHNKYLVWTIWVATITFIGAGFVGWGSYDFSGKAGSVAKVGEIEIKQSKLNMAYSNLYSRYNELFQGNFDEAKAKEMGLVQQAFSTLETQAKLLNYAQELGVVVSDDEVAKALESIKGFQRDGSFDRTVYDAYLKSRRLKAKTFEETLREELIIAKLLNLLRIDALPLEEEVLLSAINIADKVKYRVLSENDINITTDETELKKFWESKKEEFLTPKRFELEILWTDSSAAEVSDEELKSFYETNSFNYTDSQGKQLSFEEAKTQLTRDLKLKKTKKQAQRDYIAFKKGQKEATQTVTLDHGDNTLSKAVWDEIVQKNGGDILKPKVVNNRYATVKIVSVTQPRVMTFDEARARVLPLYLSQAKRDALNKLADQTLKTISESNATVSDFMSLSKYDNLDGLNSQESLQFLQKLFTSLEEKGIISVANKVVVYEITEQKHLSADENQKAKMAETVNTVKQRIFESNLLKILDTKYPTEVYMGGLTN